MSERVTIEPHHPDCRGNDPERCCYCAALIRQMLGANEDPLDYRYGGPGCACKPPAESLR